MEAAKHVVNGLIRLRAGIVEGKECVAAFPRDQKSLPWLSRNDG
jgi:hypothetical protein